MKQQKKMEEIDGKQKRVEQCGEKKQAVLKRRKNNKNADGYCGDAAEID